MDARLRSERAVESLRSAVSDARTGLSDVPGLVKRILREGLWRDRVVPRTGERVRFKSFQEFVEAEPLEGLGIELHFLEHLCEGDREAVALIRGTVGRRHGPEAVGTLELLAGGRHGGGNSRSYALQRLRLNRPDLHARVLSGELTAHGAMVAAGYRRKTIQVPSEPAAAAAALARRFSRSELAALRSSLSRLCGRATSKGGRKGGRRGGRR